MYQGMIQWHTMDNTNRVDIKMVGIDTSRVWADYDRFGTKRPWVSAIELVGWKSRKRSSSSWLSALATGVAHQTNQIETTLPMPTREVLNIDWLVQWKGDYPWNNHQCHGTKWVQIASDCILQLAGSGCAEWAQLSGPPGSNVTVLPPSTIAFAMHTDACPPRTVVYTGRLWSHTPERGRDAYDACSLPEGCNMSPL